MERALRKVPAAVLSALVLALSAQLALKQLQQGAAAQSVELPAPPARTALRLAAFGDPMPVAMLLMLYVQSFDLRGDNRSSYQRLNYGTLIEWLTLVLALDPAGQYPLMSASRIYSEVRDTEKQRQMLDFIYREFLGDPARRWPWLAEAALLAKHRLKDLPLARRYASAIQLHARGADIPLWAKQMEAFILEDMNELQAAAIMIGGFIDSGMVRSPAELRLLRQRLDGIKRRIETVK